MLSGKKKGIHADDGKLRSDGDFVNNYDDYYNECNVRCIVMVNKNNNDNHEVDYYTSLNLNDVDNNDNFFVIANCCEIYKFLIYMEV